jgi:hypothetical protein
LLYVIATVLALSFGALLVAQTPWQVVTILGIALAGGGGMYTLLTNELLSRMPPHAISFAGGMIAAAQSVVQIVVNPLIGASVDHWGDYNIAIASVTCWVLPGALIWLAMRPRTP